MVAASKTIESGQAHAFYLPNFCTSRAVLVTILIVELTALVITLGRASAGIDFWTDLARASFFLLWIGLAGAGTLCALRAYLNQQSVARGSVLVLILSAILVALISMVALWVGSLDASGYTGLGGLHQVTPWSFVARNVTIAVIVTALALRYFYVTHEWRHNVELQAQARVHALQARIRPHFLFNSMNTIAALTRSNPLRAETAVQDLADLFRATLSEKRNTIALSEEIEVARTYQRMESLRLGERLVVEWQIDALPQRAIVPGLVLQPLLENAIYHGIEPRPDGGKIKVLGEFNKGMITLIVRNPLPADNLTVREGNRLALANIRERLELMYGEHATVKSGRFDDEYIVTLRFPFKEAPQTGRH
ncbi:MAG TPA: sensor histidine kinase [Steroidobacteraceae bacterium]|nr:sensor histidine kinase [Steroidobacteraceae bacterium]HRX88598.1 sensor histidine kinase [Steroidobacteraceae bacterium]